MFKIIWKYYTQLLLKYSVSTDCIYSHVLFDYKDGDWEQILAGPGTDKIENQICTFKDQMLTRSRDQILILITHTTQDSGAILGMASNRRHIIRFFLTNRYEMSEAFTDVSLWCRKQNKQFIAKDKERYNGQSE